MAEDFLGISAHFDVSEVLNGFNELIEKLKEAGKITGETCDQMTSALIAIQNNLSNDLNADGLEKLSESLVAMRDKVIETADAIANGSSNMKLSEFAQLMAEYQNVVQASLAQTQDAHQKEADNVAQLTEQLRELEEERENAVKANASLDEISKYNSEINSLTIQLNDAQKQEKAFADTQTQTNNILQEANAIFEGITEKVPSLGEAWNNVGEALKGAKDGFGDWVTGHGKAKEAIDMFKDGLLELPGPLGGAANGFKKMWTAAKMFIQTPLGRILGVIVFLLQAFKTWATKSAEGQKVMAKVSAYLGSILESLTDILVRVGGYLYHAFADATGPMNAFATGLVTTLKHAVKAASNLLGGLGDMIRGIISMFKGDFSEGWKMIKDGGISVGKALVEAGQGFVSGLKTGISGISGIFSMIGDGASKIWNGNIMRTASSINDKAMQAVKIAGEQEEIESSIVDRQREQMYLNEQIDKSKKGIANASREELKGLVEDIKQLNSLKYDELIEAQKKRVELLREQNKLHTPTLKSIAAQQVAELELYKIEQQRNAAKRTLQQLEERREKQLDKEDKREAKAAEREKKKQEREAKAAARKAKQEKNAAERERKREYKASVAENKAAGELSETLAKNTADRGKEQKDLQDKIDKARVDAMKEGAEKTRRQRDYEHRKDLLQLQQEQDQLIEGEIAKQKAEFDKAMALRKAQGKKTWAFDRDNVDMTRINEIKKGYEELERLTKQAWDIEETKDLVNEFKDYYDQRIETEEQYNDKISRLRAQRNRAAEQEDFDEVDRITRSILLAEKARGEALAKLAIAEVKARPENTVAYEDIGRASVDTINRLIKEYKGLEDSARKAGLPVKEIHDEIKKLQDQLAKSAPFVAMESASRAAKEAHDNLEKAKKQLKELQEGRMVLKIGKDDNGKLTVSLLELSEAQENLANAQEEDVKAFNLFVEATKKSIAEIDALRASFEKLGSAIGGEIGNAIKIIGSVVGTATSGYTDILGYAAKAKELEAKGNEAGANMAKVNMWIAAMSAMMQIIGTVSKILPTADDWYERYAKKQQEINKLRRAVEEYRLSVLLAQQAERNWFGVSGLTSLTDAYEKHGKVVEAYYAKLYEAQEKYKDKSAGLSKALPYIAAIGAVIASVVTYGAAGAPILAGLASAAGVSAAAGAITAAAAGTIAGVVSAAAQSAVEKITYKNGQVAAKDNLRIQTRHKTWFRGEKTQDLASWAQDQLGAELFDGEGLINLEAARAILDKYGDKLVGETKETLEDLIKLREQYNEFMEQVEKYVTDLYSPLVDDMTDALFEWLENGTDVLRKFRENAKDTFAAIAKDMVKQMLLTGIFDQYKEDLKKIYAAYAATKNRDMLINGVMLATDNFLNTAESEIPMIQDALAKINDKFAERGFDLTGSSEEGSGAYKATQSFTQEQGDELNGRLTAIQIGQQQGIVQRSQLIELQTLTFGVVVQIGTAAVASAKDISAMRDMQYGCLSRLTEISIYTSVLPAMAENINDMRNDIRTKL